MATVRKSDSRRGHRWWGDPTVVGELWLNPTVGTPESYRADCFTWRKGLVPSREETAPVMWGVPQSVGKIQLKKLVVPQLYKKGNDIVTARTAVFDPETGTIVLEEDQRPPNWGVFLPTERVFGLIPGDAPDGWWVWVEGKWVGGWVLNPDPQGRFLTISLGGHTLEEFLVPVCVRKDDTTGVLRITPRASRNTWMVSEEQKERLLKNFK